MSDRISMTFLQNSRNFSFLSLFIRVIDHDHKKVLVDMHLDNELILSYFFFIE